MKKIIPILILPVMLFSYDNSNRILNNLADDYISCLTYTMIFSDGLTKLGSDRHKYRLTKKY